MGIMTKAVSLVFDARLTRRPDFGVTLRACPPRSRPTAPLRRNLEYDNVRSRAQGELSGEDPFAFLAHEGYP